ncbi:MAG TPA: hypothetical protein PK264_13850 [Hyphomicrobiaceae bacterium]|nr:hypothetical protein [Hyphomicrobiaceae bacterium]
MILEQEGTLKHVIRRIVALSIIAGTGMLVPASAHDWYPHDCCNDMDCAPVESAEWLAPTAGGLPQLVVTSKHGRARVRKGASIRASKDNRMHVCMKRYDPLGEMEVVCLFLPTDA